jgi:hypothetical protein
LQKWTRDKEDWRLWLERGACFHFWSKWSRTQQWIVAPKKERLSRSKREEMLKLAKQEEDRQKKSRREHWRKLRKMLGRELSWQISYGI